MQLALIIPIDIGSRPDQGLPGLPPGINYPTFPSHPIAPGGGGGSPSHPIAPGGQPPGFYPPFFPTHPIAPGGGGGSPSHPIAPGGGGNYPDQGLPSGGSPGIDNSLPIGLPPDGFILVYSPAYGWLFIPAGGPRPDQSLPGRQPGSGGKPDQSLPGSQPGVDNTLPPDQPRPDQGLPPHAQPKR